MVDLANAIRLTVLHAYYNLFLGRCTRKEWRDELMRYRFDRTVASSFHVFLAKRHPNNPWLYYGPNFK